MTYHKAIVAKITADYVIVIDQGGRFQKLVSKPDLQVGQRIYYLDQDIYPVSLSKQTRSKVIFGPFARNLVLAVACLFLVISGARWYQQHVDQQVASAMIIGFEEGLEIEINRKGEIIKFTPGLPELDNYLGRPLSESYPALRDYIAQLGQGDLMIAYSEDLVEEDLLNGLRSDDQGPNLIFTSGSLSDYQAARSARQTYSQYLIEQKEIALWTPSEGQKLTAEEKQERLGSKAHFYQVGPDHELERRQSLQSQLIYLQSLWNSLQSLGQVLNWDSQGYNDQEQDKLLETQESSRRPIESHDDDDWDDSNIHETSTRLTTVEVYQPPVDYDNDDEWDEDYDDWEDDDWDDDYDDDWDDDDWDDD